MKGAWGRRVLVVALIAATAASVSASGAASTDGSGAAAAAHRATKRTFAGFWVGHTRFLKITRRGRAKERIDDGCCNPVIDLKLRLSHPRGTSRRASIRARVTEVHVRDHSYFSRKNPPPHVGQRGRLRLRHGVIRERITGTIYCGPRASRKGRCGA